MSDSFDYTDSSRGSCDCSIHLKKTCVGQFLPGQIPRQIFTGQDRIQQQDFVIINEIGTTVDGTGFGTGSILPLFPLVLLTLAITMMGMTTMSDVTIGTTTVPVTVPTTITATISATQTTPCVPTNCPAGYRMINDQTISTSCYFYSVNNEASWSTAQKICSMQPGAYLWKPDSQQEAEAVQSAFSIVSVPKGQEGPVPKQCAPEGTKEDVPQDLVVEAVEQSAPVAADPEVSVSGEQEVPVLVNGMETLATSEETLVTPDETEVPTAHSEKQSASVPASTDPMGFKREIPDT
ncbi:uncharacterized protein LOC134698121 [Mytilus trossulus]|uniref:uncharacterized protein LOC134698121 n=1 Tax=Mytilus trossulus TaxID=6551 RepID=UPI00300677C2